MVHKLILGARSLLLGKQCPITIQGKAVSRFSKGAGLLCQLANIALM